MFSLRHGAQLGVAQQGEPHLADQHLLCHGLFGGRHGRHHREHLRLTGGDVLREFARLGALSIWHLFGYLALFLLALAEGADLAGSRAYHGGRQGSELSTKNIPFEPDAIVLFLDELHNVFFFGFEV